MDLFDLVAKITLDSSEYEKGLSQASNSAGGFGGKVATAMKGAVAGVAALTTATVAVSGAFIKATGSVAEYGDHIDKMSQKMGLSAEKYQEWDAILQHSGTSIDTMKAGMKTLANAVENGNDAFERIGLTQQQIASMSQEELFEATISGLQNVEDTTERTYLAGQLLGRGATELGALLNTSAEDTEAMRQRVHELGGVMSDEAVKAAAKYQDSLQDMRTALDGTKRNIMSSFLPSITLMMDGLANVFSGNEEEGFDQIEEGVSQFIEVLTDAMPRVIELGSQIIRALGDALLENLPALITTGIQVITRLVVGLIQALPTIIATIVEALPSILEAIWNAIIEAGTALLDVGADVVSNLWQGMWQKFQGLISSAKSWAGDVVQSIKSGLGSLFSAGADLIQGLWDGIKQKYEALKEWAGETFGGFIDFVKDIFGISSPSKVFKEIGGYVTEGFALGIGDNLDMVENASNAMYGATDVVPAGGASGLIGTTEGEFGRVAAILQEWLPQMTNMDIILDSGALVGELTYDIDRSMGRRQQGRSRGNAR